MRYTISDFQNSYAGRVRCIAGAGGLSRPISEVALLDYELVPGLKNTYQRVNFYENQLVLTSFLYARESPHLITEAVKYLIAQACLCRSARIAADVAEILGLAEDRAHWEELAERSRAAFRRTYVLEGGRLTSDAVAAYALALHFGLLEGNEVAPAADRLAELVREGNYKVATGFAGTPYVTWALSENGHAEEAYRLLLEDECPSWLYPVRMGATTTWERWDSMLPDGSINPGDMTSFNHYALGAVCDWIYQVIGGISPAAPGYARVRIAPKPGEGITWARCAFESVQGRIEVFWRCENGRFDLECTVPEGVSADVELPDGTVCAVSGGTHRFGCAA